jgi:hypothetical protein
MLVRQTDRILEKGKGKTMFFLSGLAKLFVVAGVFFVASRLAGYGAIFFFQGLAMTYLGIAAAGLQRSLSHRRHGT